MLRGIGSTFALVALGLAATPAVGSAVAPTSPGAQAQPAPGPPPDLVALEQKMELLHVKSERYSTQSRGTIKITNEANGKPAGPSRHVSLNGSAAGVVSLSPSESEESISASAGRTQAITIGSTSYVRPPAASKLARLDGGRPWIRSRATSPTSFPFHGSSEEVSLGGSGPYAGLVNVLATAVGPVVETGPAVVNGQQTEVFEGAFDPFRLVRGLTQQDLAGLEGQPPAYHLTVYLAASGVPLRVVVRERTPPGNNTVVDSTTTEVLALEVPVAIEPPPADRTISQARFNELAAKHGRQLGIEEQTVTSSVREPLSDSRRSEQ
jgi:hypothetical protein